jgi:hypothetical protein
LEEKYSETWERAEGSISPMQTVAPRDERILAAARPIPEAPPVTPIILFCMDILNGVEAGYYIVSMEGHQNPTRLGIS